MVGISEYTEQPTHEHDSLPLSPSSLSEKNQNHKWKQSEWIARDTSGSMAKENKHSLRLNWRWDQFQSFFPRKSLWRSSRVGTKNILFASPDYDCSNNQICREKVWSDCDLETANRHRNWGWSRKNVWETDNCFQFAKMSGSKTLEI